MKIQELFLNVRRFLFLLFVVLCVVYVVVSIRQNFVGDNAFTLDYPEVEFKGDLSIDVNMAVADVREVLNKYNLFFRPKSFSVNVDDIMQDISQLAWVKNVSVVKEYPSKLLIVIEPKNIIAYMFDNEEYFPVDSDGNLIMSGVDYKSGLLITGDGANSNLNDLMTSIKKYPRIWNKVVYLQYVNNLRWNIFLYSFENGIMVKLAQDNVDEALAKLNRLDVEKDLLKRNISEIDIRDINKILVR